MSRQTYNGIIQDGRVRLLDAVQALPEGTPALVTTIPAPVGAVAVVIAAVDAAPPAAAVWVDELEQLIRAGEQPADLSNPFAGISDG